MEKNSNIPQPSAADVEPFFLVSGSTDLVFDDGDSARLGEFLCHAITRNSQDLRSHVRRILLEYRSGGGDSLFAALVDLFLVLETRGIDLRTRLLEFSRNRLPPDQYRLLKDSLEPGLQEARVPQVKGSLILKGAEGSFQYARLASEEILSHEDPLMLARQFLEYSQVDEARSLLEQAILDRPDIPDLQKELVDIYKATRDRAAFLAMSARLKDLEIPICAEWRELAAQFRSSDG